MSSTLTLAIRVKPGASRARVGGRHEGSFGTALVVAVNAPPVDGRATEAALRAVAQALGVPPRTVTLRTGATGRDKLIDIADPPEGLETRLSRLLGG